MYNIITERNLREALESIPAQYTVDMEKIKQVRYSTGRGMYICKMLAERKESVEEAVKLYHDIMKVIVDSENLCRRAMEIYGFPAQAAMVVEECSELTNAICKFRRGRVGEDDIITEIADVMIMCEQLSNYFGKEKVELEKERKLERLKERLSKYTD